MNDDDLLRYSRHILLPQIDVSGQTKISQSKIMIVGLGGLGSPVAMYLAAAGVGELFLVDDDTVELSNLQRQIVHTEEALGQQKVNSARARLHTLNSRVSITSLTQRFDETKLGDILQDLTAVVDCTDSFAARDTINRACRRYKIPLVSAAAIGFEAQLATFDFRNAASPCYRCLYDELDDRQLSCAQSGVFAPLLGVAGSMQALEVLKIAAGLQPSFAGRLSLFDGLAGAWRTLNISKRENCKVCANNKS